MGEYSEDFRTLSDLFVSLGLSMWACRLLKIITNNNYRGALVGAVNVAITLIVSKLREDSDGYEGWNSFEAILTLMLLNHVAIRRSNVCGVIGTSSLGNFDAIVLGVL